MRVRKVLETVLYTRDLETLARFYGDVLGLERVAGTAGREAFLVAGGSMLLLFDPDETRKGGSLPPHGAEPGRVHVAFEVDDYEGWRERLRARGVEVVQEQRWPHGPRSLYFHDPAGNLLELAEEGLWPVRP